MKLKMKWPWNRSKTIVIKRMQKAEMEELLAGVEVDTPLFVAMVQLADEMIVEIHDQALDPKLSDAETKYILGGVDSLGRLRDRLVDAVVTARQKRLEEENKRSKTQK